MIPATSLIPIRDENPTRTFSYLTLTLIAVNVLVWLTEPNFGIGLNLDLARFFCRWGVVPYEISGHAPAVPVFCPVMPDKIVYLSLVTSMFLHGGPIHLAGNMLFLWVFGNNIEDTLGKVRFIIFYLLTGVIAGYAHVLLSSDSSIPTVGASGAVAGMLGAYIVLFPRARVTTLVIFYYITSIRLPAMVVLGIWFVSQLFIGAGQQLGGAGVAWAAHVGGFAAGAALIYPFGGRATSRRV